MAAGRKSKYEDYVQPYLTDIPEMLQTMTEEQIAKRLGVSYGRWFEYKKQYSELREVIKKGRVDFVSELRSVLKQRARGFKYTEEKIIEKDGEIVQKETYVKQALPDVAALNLLLKNLDRENWANDPQMIDLRKKELELQEKKIEQGEWN